jgi:hypothetical protein
LAGFGLGFDDLGDIVPFSNIFECKGILDWEIDKCMTLAPLELL